MIEQNLRPVNVVQSMLAKNMKVRLKMAEELTSKDGNDYALKTNGN
jgi:hypothetical protein